MKTIEKIKNKIKELNKNKNNILYWISSSILALIGIFIFVTMIIQSQWIGINNIEVPILIWIITSPNVGIFFLPFIILLSYVCWFIVSVGKPVTIKRVINDSRSLYENHEIKKNEYEVIYNELINAQERKEQEILFKNEKLKKELESIKKNLGEINEEENI